MHAIGILARALLHHHAVSALRHDAAGENADAFAGADRSDPGFAGKRFSNASEHRFAVLLEIGEAHRIAIHRRVVVPWHGDRRNHVGGEHPAKRLADMHALDRRDGRQKRADKLACLHDRHRIGIVVVGTRRFTQCFRLSHAGVSFAEFIRDFRPGESFPTPCDATPVAISGRCRPASIRRWY